jgi:hypothetical protein
MELLLRLQGDDGVASNGHLLSEAKIDIRRLLNNRVVDKHVGDKYMLEDIYDVFNLILKGM